jgi:transcriptional regulator of acetoin/glycerol metabolism
VDVAQLQVLLERNEWNVSRVARVVGVTRMTIYNRMRRAGIPRQRIPKTRRKALAATRA